MQEKRKKGEIIIYERRDGAHFEVTLQDESIWLSQKQIAFLFNVRRPAVTKHLNNIFESEELKEKSVSSKMEHTAADGKKYKTSFYNLDAIIAVGYRVNSKRATQFRMWATDVLKDHILKGYTLNEKRLKESRTIKLKELEKTIALLQGIVRSKSLNTIEARGLLSVIVDYANSWILLQEYDTGNLTIKKTITKGISYIGDEEAMDTIRALKDYVQKKNEGSDIFGIERQIGVVEGILMSIRQSFGGKNSIRVLKKRLDTFYILLSSNIRLLTVINVSHLCCLFFFSQKITISTKKMANGR